jgi:hypothetical protein
MPKESFDYNEDICHQQIGLKFIEQSTKTATFGTELYMVLKLGYFGQKYLEGFEMWCGESWIR